MASDGKGAKLYCGVEAMRDEIDNDGRNYSFASDCWSLGSYMCMYGYQNELVTIQIVPFCSHRPQIVSPSRLL